MYIQQAIGLHGSPGAGAKSSELQAIMLCVVRGIQGTAC